MTKTVAWIAPAAKQEFVRQEVDLGPPGDKEVEVAVEHCGLCHSDLSVLNNEWSFLQFSTVLGHEVTGRVVAVGSAAKGISVGQRVDLGLDVEQLDTLSMEIRNFLVACIETADNLQP
jgi:uncharacterized zinc-type alcohol dehydrogenase-like protein